MKRYKPFHLTLLVCICLVLTDNANGRKSSVDLQLPYPLRGGGIGNDGIVDNFSANATAVTRNVNDRDGQDEASHSTDSHGGADETDHSAASGGDEEDDPAIVGVKSHSKKSNAVGDPDGDSDDDDDDSDETTEYSEEWEELEDLGEFEDVVVLEPQVQVEVEVMEDGGTPEATSSNTGGGGVGVRLGRMNNRRKSRKERKSSGVSSSEHPSLEQKRLLQAWMPHIFFPPTSKALAFLSNSARFMDASSKSRLDRRTLYGSLLLEWGCTSNEGPINSMTRKFFPPQTSQSLHAALSMATQPQWRQSSPRTSGIRLYQDEPNGKTCTLAMQETTAMALVSVNTKLLFQLFVSSLY